MKKLSLFVIILSSIFLSCEKEEIQSNLNQENLIVNETLQGSGTIPDNDYFSNTLDWTTYIVGDVLRRNTDLKIFALSQLDPTTQTIPITSLLVANGPESTLFREKFIQRYLFFTACVQANVNTNDNNTLEANDCPGGIDSPGHIGCPTCLNSILDPEDLLNYLIQEHCVEFYFPRSIVIVVIPNHVTSVVHPFTNADTNRGYQHNAAGVRAVNRVEDFYMMNTNQTVIVGRPIRTTDDQCTYTQYDVDSFTTYLEGPF